MRQILSLAKSQTYDVLLFMVSLGILPFVVGPAWIFGIQYELPKSWLTIGLILMLAIFLFVDQLRRKSVQKVDGKVLFLLSILFVTMAVSSILNGTLSQSIIGNAYRLDGLVRLLAFVLFSTWVVYRFELKQLRTSFFVLAGASTILSILTIIIFLMQWQGSFSYFPQIALTFGQANFLGGYLAVTLPFLFQAKRRRIWFLVVIQVIAIVLTQSWGALLAVGLGMLFWKMKKVELFIVASVIIFAIYLFIQYKIYPPNQVAESRIRVYYTLLQSFTHKPILGWGWANTTRAFEAVEWPVQRTEDVYVDQAHSNVLEMLIGGGVVGAGIYLAIIVMTLRTYKDAQKDQHAFILLTVFLIFLFHSQTNIISVNEELLFWWIVGIGAKNSN